ncbi:alkaline phosphatase family protein, partial [Akkermansia sp.]
MKLPRTRVAVIDVVALSRQMMEHMPRLSAWAEGRRVSSFPPAFPALTCSAQSTYVTGLSPREHAIPGNGWYNRNMSEIQFWKQSNKLVQGPRLWEKLRERYGPGFTCAKLFWWYNMYSTADWTITPRPMYPADGRK